MTTGNAVTPAVPLCCESWSLLRSSIYSSNHILEKLLELFFLRLADKRHTSQTRSSLHVSKFCWVLSVKSADRKWLLTFIRYNNVHVWEHEAMVNWLWKGKTEVIGGKEKLDSVPLCPAQMTKASRDLICHTSEDGRHCLQRKGNGICGGGCGDCQPNCQHSRTIVNERTFCIHQLYYTACLMLNILYTSAAPQNMSHVEHSVYISCASEHVSRWTLCIHQLCLRTCLMSNILYTSAVPQNMSHVEHPVYISCASEHVSCWTSCIHQLCLRTCHMLNNLYTSAAPQNMSHVEHPVHISCASEHVSCWTWQLRINWSVQTLHIPYCLAVTSAVCVAYTMFISLNERLRGFPGSNQVEK